MAAKAESQGTCGLCGYRSGKRGMGRHLSTFFMRPGGVKGAGRRCRSVWSDDEIDMEKRAGDVLHAPVELTHVYDFGTSTELSIKRWAPGRGALSARRSASWRATIRLYGHAPSAARRFDM
jgi:hypothetical protein